MFALLLLKGVIIMSFSLDVKKELSEIKNLANKEAVRYELIGYLISNNINEEKSKIKYSTENEYNINRYAKLLRNVDIDNFKIDILGKVFVISFNKNKLNIDISFENIDEELIKSLTRGVFLGSGSVNNPENKYHLEIELKDDQIAKNLQNELKKYGISMKIMKNTLYLKDGERISNFLAFIGAVKAMLRFEEIRVQRDMNNKVNRLVNCETANLNKVLNASVEQIEAIRKLKKNGKFKKIDDSLKEIAELRLKHPDMSLENLGKLLKNPIGKSGVNYRLKKIIDMTK